MKFLILKAKVNVSSLISKVKHTHTLEITSLYLLIRYIRYNGFNVSWFFLTIYATTIFNSDHLPVFSISKPKLERKCTKKLLNNRITNQENITSFKQELAKQTWEDVYKAENVGERA